MSLEDNKRVVRRYYSDVVSTGAIGLIEQFIAPNYAEVHEGKRFELGIEGARQHVLGVRRTYPDLIVRVDQQIAEGEWVASCVTAIGTQHGEWIGIKPTGKHFEFTGVNIDRVVNGKIVEHGGAANLLLPLLQSGSIKIAH